MFRKLFLINLSLFVAAVLLAVWVVEIWSKPVGARIKVDPRPPKHISKDEYTFEKMPAGFGYDLMVERDLFRPDRKRYIPPQPSPTPTPSAQKGKPNFVVVGIMILSERVKYAIIGESSPAKPKLKKPKRRWRRWRRGRKRQTPTPPPLKLLKPRSYHEGEEVKDGWYVAQIKPMSVVFANGTESIEVPLKKAKVPIEKEEKQSKGKRPLTKLGAGLTAKSPPAPPSKDEATRRFLEALRKARKRK